MHYNNYNDNLDEIKWFFSFMSNWCQFYRQLVLLCPWCLHWLQVCTRWDSDQSISFLMCGDLGRPFRRNLDSCGIIIGSLLSGMVSPQPRVFQFAKYAWMMVSILYTLSTYWYWLMLRWTHTTMTWEQGYL